MKLVLTLLMLTSATALVNGSYVYNRQKHYGSNKETSTPRSLHELHDRSRFRQFHFPSGESHQSYSDTQTDTSTSPVAGYMKRTTGWYLQGRTSKSSSVFNGDNRSYLDPRNFRPPALMTLEEMERILAEIELHTGNNSKNKTADYTGSRVLVQMLREQCARLASSGSAQLEVFCTQVDTRFRRI